MSEGLTRFDSVPISIASADRPARLVPVPTTAARERKRGYNQSERLASALARVLDQSPPVPCSIERTKCSGQCRVPVFQEQRQPGIQMSSYF